ARMLTPNWVGSQEGSPGWYWSFWDQVPEQKEMLVGVALLMYGLYRLQKKG
ncbi:MAG: hypothetical protein GY769_04220, partial [bacterium]|nr:hypothetical protein [bacterium]